MEAPQETWAKLVRLLMSFESWRLNADFVLRRMRDLCLTNNAPHGK